MIEIRPVAFESLLGIGSIDLLICSLGMEFRATSLSQRLKDVPIKRKVCVKLLEEVNTKELSCFLELGFTFVNPRDLRSEIENSAGDTIVVDYSVMMKSLYADIIKQFSNSPVLRKSRFLFSYTKSIFEEPADSYMQVKNIEQVLLTPGKSVESKKTKLLIGLGYERLSAVGVVEVLEINYDDVLVFVNKESDDSPHYLRCLEVNKDFLELLDPKHIFEVNFYNFNQTSTTLNSIVYGLGRDGYDVILAPMTMKMFSLISMVVSLRHDNARFYNVTSVHKKPFYKKFPDTDSLPIVYELYTDLEGVEPII